MRNNPKERIFAKLRTAVAQGDFDIPDHPPLTWPEIDSAERIASFKQKMAAMKTDVCVTSSDGWVTALKALLKGKNLQKMVYAPETPVGKMLKEGWDSADGLPELVAYDGSVETYKEELFFSVDAAVTTATAGIADTGAVILWPDENEPRLNSLVPPLHIVVLEAKDIYSTFSGMMEAQHWADGMPTNALLISGPSKTADIELVLVFGVHGPSEMIVLVLES